MLRNLIISVIILLLMTCISIAMESPLTISDIHVNTSIVSPGDIVTISCRVTHSAGSESIKIVAATMFYGKWTTQFQKLYDDGTNGDRVDGDGIYSLEIYAPGVVGDARTVFQAVDTSGQEIESEPVILSVK